MKEITDVKEIQKIELGLLEKIHKFCEEYHLKYSLCGGTLLGAIRHKGFIPWDDDVDIFMPRPDYEKFCKEFKVDGASVHTYKSDKSYIYPFAKVYDDNTLLIENAFPEIEAGVYVDVFPIDGFSVNYEKDGRRILRLRSYIYQFMGAKKSAWFREGRSLKRMISLPIFKLFSWMIPSSWCLACFSFFVSWSNYEKSPFRGCMSWGYGVREILSKSCFDDFIDIEFEGKNFKVMKGWKSYLSNLYGDYMQLPPVEKRVSNHSFKAWYKK